MPASFSSFLLLCRILVRRVPNQTIDEFDLFLDRLQLTVDCVKNCKPHNIVITGDFNCRSKQWWPRDVELPEGSAFDEFIESNNVSQLIDEPTNVQTTGISCIGLIITDQPNLFVDFRVHPFLDNHCQHQIIHGKLNISIPTCLPYKRKIWYYEKAQNLVGKSFTTGGRIDACVASTNCIMIRVPCTFSLINLTYLLILEFIHL